MYIEQTYSTNTLLREQYAPNLPHLFTIRTDYQTAGRGQQGNTWESQRGQNLLCSTLLKLGTNSTCQSFQINMAVSLALYEVVTNTMHITTPLSIKWPNDLYYADKKMAGILIENQLIGTSIAWSVVGVGLNVNQTQWFSNAPNPISMKQISGQTYDIESILTSFLASLEQWLTCTPSHRKKCYMQHLYRRMGWYSYVERDVNITPTAIAHTSEPNQFEAEIVDVTNMGELLLRRSNNDIHSYHFKQIRFVI